MLNLGINFRDISAPLQRIPLEHRYARPLLTGLVAAVSTGLLFLLRRDYLLFLSYGPGGIAYNVFGWFGTNTFMRLFTKNRRTLAPYDDPNLPFASEAGWLPENFPPRRVGGRPQLGPHPVPQRQIGDLPDKAMRAKTIAAFRALGKELEEKGVVEVRTSRLELNSLAFFLKGRRHEVAEEMNGEIAHVHEYMDTTFHVTLSPQDCKKVLEAEWGERHGLAGNKLIKKLVGFSVPYHYMLVYAPRDEKEIEIVMTILKAAVGFMAGRKDL